MLTLCYGGRAGLRHYGRQVPVSVLQLRESESDSVPGHVHVYVAAWLLELARCALLALRAARRRRLRGSSSSSSTLRLRDSAYDVGAWRGERAQRLHTLGFTTHKDRSLQYLQW